MALATSPNRRLFARIRNHRFGVPFMAVSLCLWLAAKPAQAQTISVTKPSGFAVSPRLTDLPHFEGHNPLTQHVHHPLEGRGNAGNQQGHDDALQISPEPLVEAFPRAYFGGIGFNGAVPPDTNIAVGPNHIVELVNVEYAVFDKNGALLAGPNLLGDLWSNLGGDCAANIGSDPIVQNDRLSDRWLIT